MSTTIEYRVTANGATLSPASYTEYYNRLTYKGQSKDNYFQVYGLPQAKLHAEEWKAAYPADKVAIQKLTTVTEELPDQEPQTLHSNLNLKPVKTIEINFKYSVHDSVWVMAANSIMLCRITNRTGCYSESSHQDGRIVISYHLTPVEEGVKMSQISGFYEEVVFATKEELIATL